MNVKDILMDNLSFTGLFKTKKESKGHSKGQFVS
jgi:hypothetical protein